MVYDLVGREVAALVNEQKEPLAYRVQSNAEGLASGVYFYRILAGGFSEARKLVVAR